MVRAVVITLVTVTFVLWIDKRREPWIRKMLNWFPAILFAYAIPAIITHATGWDLSQVYLHSISRDWIIPLAILTVMSALSFRQLRIVGFRPVLLFVLGSFAIATLPVLLVIIGAQINPPTGELFIAGEYWKGLVPIVGGWIGGSTSQLVLKELVECPDALFFAILVLDNILVNIWTILMFQLIQRSEDLNRFFGITDVVPDFVPDEVVIDSGDRADIIKMLVIITGLLLLGVFLIESFLWSVVAFSLAGLLLGNLVSWWRRDFILKLGGILIILIMAILGLRLNFNALTLPVALVVTVVIWLLLHFIIMMVIARLMRLHMAWVPIASMANLGGISTAPAVTAAYNEEWMPHAILLAILSMVTGTAWGMVTIALFNLF